MNIKTQTKLKALTKSLIIAGIISAVALPAAAKNYRDSSSYGSSSSFDYAKVVDVTPVIETYKVNNPVEKCWDERVAVRKSDYSNQRSSRGYDSKTPEIFGAIIGAAVGNRLGKRGGGKARDVATVAGAVLGGSVARDVKHKNRANRNQYNDRYEQTRYETVQQCEVRDSYTTKEQVVGYDVAYKYRGNVFHTQMDQHPGDKIKVKVTVNPV